MHTINLDYDYWTAGNLIIVSLSISSRFLYCSDEILQTLLPEELRDGSPTGFAATGHIGNYNNMLTAYFSQAGIQLI